jgi:hypothetical protein
MSCGTRVMWQDQKGLGPGGCENRELKVELRRLDYSALFAGFTAS